MKKEHFIFLSLIVASAVVMGIMLGFVSNFQYISQRVETLQATAVQQQAEFEKETTDVSINDNSSIQLSNNESPNQVLIQPELIESENKQVINDAPDLEVKPVVHNTGLTTPEVVVLSLAERQQILSVLHSLGMKDSNNYNDFIMEYQKKHGLNPTGNMDEPTLDAMINESTKEKFDQIANRVNEL